MLNKSIKKENKTRGAIIHEKRMRELKGYKPISELTRKVSPIGVNTVRGSMRGVEPRKVYVRLLKGKISDEKIRDKIIMNRRKTMRDGGLKTIAELWDSDNERVARLEILGLLVEEEYEINEEFEGIETIMSENDWNKKIKKWEEFLKSKYGIKGVRCSVFKYNEPVHIKRISIEHQYS